jgi:hypothetical protein
MEITKEEMVRRFRERTTKNLCPTMDGGSFIQTIRIRIQSQNTNFFTDEQ